MQEEELAKAQWRGAYFIDVQKKQLNINMNQNLMTNELVFVECMVAQFLMPDFVQWINRIKGMGVSLLFCKKQD